MSTIRIIHLPALGPSATSSEHERAILGDCLEIRDVVFRVGQGVPREREFDGLDQDADHFLAYRESTEGRTPLGTARMRRIDRDAKAERVAVLECMRGLGIGRLLMGALEEAARASDCRSVVLSAQVPVIPFYERLGYLAHGPIYDDVGIPHRDMRRDLE